MLPCSQGTTNINKSCEWCSSIFRDQHQLEGSHGMDAVVHVDGGASGQESSSFSVCGERDEHKRGMAEVTKSRKFLDRTQHTVSPGDARQVALFCFLWDRAAVDTQGTLVEGDKKEGLCSSLRIDEAICEPSPHRDHTNSDLLSLKPTCISEGCGERQSTPSPAVGSVGWAGVANILTSALARRRAFYKNPCTCEECLVYTASNAKPGSLYIAPVITTEAVGKVRPLRKGGKEDTTTPSATSNNDSKDVSDGNCAPAFSHRSIFIDQAPQSRFLLACGGGLRQISSDISVAKQEVEAATTAILNPLAESLDAVCFSVKGKRTTGARNSTTEKRESRAADDGRGQSGADATAKIFSSASFVARKSATRAQYFARGRGLLAAPHSTYPRARKKPTPAARQGKVGVFDEGFDHIHGLDEEKEVEDDPYAISKIPPNALPFVTKYLQHNRPLTLLRFSPRVVGGVGGTVASDLVACAARSIGWHQHLLGEQLRELDTHTEMVERLKEWARIHRDSLVSNLLSETELQKGHDKNDTHQKSKNTTRTPHPAPNYIYRIDSLLSAFARELDRATFRISHSASGHGKINDCGAAMQPPQRTSESDSPPARFNSRYHDSRLDDSVGSRLTYEGVSAATEWVLKDLSPSASDAPHNYSTSSSSSNSSIGTSGGSRMSSSITCSSNHSFSSSSLPLSSRLLITNYRQEEKRRGRGKYDHSSKGGEGGTPFSCDKGFCFEEDGGLSILGIIFECLTETIFGTEPIEVDHSVSNCDTFLSGSETANSQRRSTVRRLASALESFARLEQHMLAAMAVEQQHTNNSSQSTRVARNSKDSMAVVMDGLDLLLSPIANIYRPASVAIWNARDSPSAISSPYNLFQMRSHHHYLRVSNKSNSNSDACVCANGEEERRCFSCNRDNDDDPPRAFDPYTTELGPDTLLSCDAIMRHILLSQHPPSQSSSLSSASLLFSPSKAEISEVCIGLSKVSRSLLLTLSSLCPTLTVLVLDGVEGWSELAPRGLFSLVKRPICEVGRPPGLLRLEHGVDNSTVTTTPSSPWFLLAGLLGLGRCSKTSYTYHPFCDGGAHSTPLQIRTPPLKTLIISNILGAFSAGGKAKEVSISGWWDIPTDRLFELNPGFAVFADAVSASPTLEQLSLSSMGLADRELAVFWAAACGQKDLVSDTSSQYVSQYVPPPPHSSRYPRLDGDANSAPLGDQEKTKASRLHLRGFVTLLHFDLSGNKIGQRGLERAAAISDETRADIKKSKETQLQECPDHEEFRTISSMDLSRNIPTMSTIDGTVLARCVCSLLAPCALFSDSASGSVKKGQGLRVPANGIGLSLRHSNIPGVELSKFFRAFRRQVPSKDHLFSHFAFSSGASDVDASLFKMLADCFTSPLSPASSPSPSFIRVRDLRLNSLDLSSVDLSLASASSGSASYSSSSSATTAAFPTTHIFFTQILPSLLPHLSRLNLSNCGLNDAGCQRLCLSFEKVIESLRSTEAKVGGEECPAIPSGGQKSAQQSAWVLQQQQKKKIKEAAAQQKKKKGTDKTDNTTSTCSNNASANASENNSNSNERRDHSMMDPEKQRPAADTNCLPLMVLRLDDNPIGLEGLRYIIRATRSGTCPRLAHLGLSSLSSGGGHVSSSSLPSSASASTSGAGRATRAGLLVPTTSASASSPCSLAHYRFKDKFSELGGETAAVLRYMSAQLNHSHLTILDLSANRSMISQISFVLELLRLFNNERVAEWESRVACAVAFISKTVAKEKISAGGENAEKECDDEGQKERMKHLARSCVNVLPERPPTLSIVLRNIDTNWEADLSHDPRFSLPFAQCIFS